MKNLFLACVLFLWSGQSFAQPSDDLRTLAEWLTGSFSSEKQAKENADYRNIVLHATEIWPDANRKFIWIYVEQATAENPDKPYRQRIYKLEQPLEDVFSSTIYSLPQPEAYVGAWETPILFDNLKPSDLMERSGCAVYLKYDGLANFDGSTDGKSCQSDFKGAEYATSEVLVTQNQIVSWDRGFDANDKQVWGAERGGYVFDRQED